MKSGISFKERAELGEEILAKQPPVTLEQLRAQGLWIKNPKLFDKYFANGGTIENTKANAAKFLKDNPDKFQGLYKEFSESKANPLRKTK